MTDQPEYPGDATDEAAQEAAARRSTLTEVFPAAAKTILQRLQEIGAAERAIDHLLTAGLAATHTPSMGLPRVELKDWFENRISHMPTFTPPVPVLDPTPGELAEIRRTLVYLRGVLSLHIDAAGEALKKLLTDADTEGIYVPTTLDPVTPQDFQS